MKKQWGYPGIKAVGMGVKGGNLKIPASVGHWLEGTMKDMKDDFPDRKDI